MRPPFNVLIVDDDGNNRKLLSALVESEGCVALAVDSGCAALELISERQVDAVLLDIMMPEMTGHQVLEELAKRGLLPGLPVLVVTALDEREHRISALEFGAVDFVSKPIDRVDLQARLRNALELRQLRMKLAERGTVLEGVVRSQAEDFNTVVESVPSLVFGLDTNGRIRTLNQMARRLPGAHPGEQFASLFEPKETDRLAAALRQTAGTGWVQTLEVNSRDVQGEPVVLEVTIAPVEVDGRLSSLVAIGHDRTREQQMVQELEVRTHELRRAQEVARIGSWRINLDTGGVVLTPESLRILGLSDSQTTLDHVTDVFSGHGELEKFERALDEVRRGLSATASLELRVDGALRWVLLKAEPATTGDDGHRTAIVTIEDHTELRLVELARQEARVKAVEAARRLAVLLDKLPLVLWETTVESGAFVTRWVSPNAKRVLGVSAEELLGRDGWSEYVHPEDVARLYRPSRPDPDSRTSWIELVRWCSPDGRVLHVQNGVSAIDTPNGRRLIGFTLDVTQSKDLEAALLQAQKVEAVGQLTGGIAHDFNNMLAVILSYAGFVRDGLSESDPARADVIEVLRAGEKAAALTRRLLSFARQQPVAERKPIDLNDRISDLHRMLRRTMGDHITVEVAPSPRPAIVRMDPIQFDQVVLNLVVNARDAMPDGGTVRLTITQPTDLEEFEGESVVRLVVSDTGLGIDPDHLAQVFEPFFTTKKAGEGTGLGLATCRAIVQDADGRMSVQSELGRGTEFWIDLPMCDEQLFAQDFATLDVAPMVSGARILVVEDDNAVRAAAVRILDAAGNEVLEAADGDEAMAILGSAKNPFDLVFCDIVVPGASGYEVAAYAQKRFSDTRVLLTSGYLSETSATTNPELDSLPMLWKPYRASSLLHAVRDALGTSRAEVEAPRSHPDEGPSLRRVLMVEDGDELARANRRILRAGGYEVEREATVAGAVQALTGDREFSVVLCDLGLPDGEGIEVLEALVRARPTIRERILVLTASRIGPELRDWIDRGLRVLSKPAGIAQLLGAVDDVAVPIVGPAPVSRSPESILPREERVLVVQADRAVGEETSRKLGRPGRVVLTADSVEGAVDLLDEGPVDVVLADSGLEGLIPQIRDMHVDLPVLAMGAEASIGAAMREGAQGFVPTSSSSADIGAELARLLSRADDDRVRRRLIAAQVDLKGLPRESAHLRESLQKALRQVEVATQPIVRSRDYTVFGQELLPRFESFGSPRRVLDVASALDILDEARLVMRDAGARLIRASDAAGRTYFVNLDPDELNQGGLTRGDELLSKVASRVVLEISGQAPGEMALDPELAEEARSIGFRLCVDNVGGGGASLPQLVALSPDFAKIDRSLVRDAPDSQAKRAVISGLVAACGQCGITVIAGGVETPQEAALMSELGCDLLQGFFIGGPRLEPEHQR